MAKDYSAACSLQGDVVNVQDVPGKPVTKGLLGGRPFSLPDLLN
ncbi:hypothetical protein [Sideroxydans sp. CL21]|nr:hypothetical protein [Sideroxydans sp. CL21]